MIQSLTVLSDEVGSKNERIKQLQEQIEKSHDEHKENIVKYQELENRTQRVLSDLMQKEVENIAIRKEYEQEFSTSTSVSLIQ